MSKEDINNIIIKSNRNLTTALLRMVELGKTKKLKFKLPNDIYTRVYDKKMYPFFHFFISQLALRILSNLNLQCPFSKNNIHFTKSIGYINTYNTQSLSGIYSIKGTDIPTNMNLACIISTVPVLRKNNYNTYSYSIIKKISEHVNVIIKKTNLPNLCNSFGTVVCKSKRQRMFSQNKRFTTQIRQWKYKEKNGKLSPYLCYTITEVPELTLYKYLQTNTFDKDEWKSILFQISYTMYILKKEIPKFVHHNLTPKNIFIQKVPPGGQFIYSIGKINYYVPNYGYIIKILPDSLSYAKGVYDNVAIFDEELKSKLGLNVENKQFYDLHSFFNALYFTKNVPDYIKKIVKQLLPRKYISDQNTLNVINKRLRSPRLDYSTKGVKTFKDVIMKTKLFEDMKTINKSTIIFYPKIV